MGPRSAALLLALSLALSSTAYAQELVLGNRPPTPEEQAYIDAKYTETSSVAPNRLAWDRERAEIAAARARGDTVPRADGLPALVDNSTLQYFPQPDWQNHNDCTCWTACYYYNTYTQAADEGYDVTSLDTDHICSPAFMYPLVNGGLDSGANLQFVMGRLTDVGCASLTLAPDSSSDFTSWPTEAAWVDALRNRTQSAQFVDGSTAAGLDAIKQHLANGNLAATAFGLHANFDDYYPYDTTGIDSEVYYCPDGDQRTTHTGALVGYDDDKTYVDHRDGETHFGAFLVANSLGNLFGVQNSTGTGTKGFFWVAYAMFTESTFGPEVYYNDDRDDYRPRLYAVAGVNHSARGSLCLSGGTGPTPIPSWTSYYAIYEDGGTALAVDDTRRIAVDLSEGVTPGPTLDVFVRLHVALWAFANGTISSADFYSDFDRDGVYTVTTSADPTVVVGFGGAGYATASLPTIPGAVIHVKLDGSDAADGLTWGAAKQTVQAGLDACYAGDEVWVAAGIHVQPSINLRAGVALYGGFDGTETEREQRDWRSNVTVLDANYAGPVVVVETGAPVSTRIDGFTIRRGVADGAVGGGINCWAASATIVNNVITENTAPNGGGLCFSGYTPVVANNVITGNGADDAAGGVYCNNTSAIVFGNVIADNGPLSAIHTCYGNSMIVGNTITGNDTAVSCLDSEATVANNIIAYNEVGIVWGGNGPPWLQNNCVYGNTFSDYYQISPGSNDISVDPQFVDYEAGDLHLLPTSPCIDAGEDGFVEPGDVDMDGEPRIMGVHVDIGADELPTQELAVLLEVHPNERAPGLSSSQFLGVTPWTQPTASPHSSYMWKKYEFYANGPLWVQVCAQNWDQWQKGYASDDNTWLDVNGIRPADYDGIQNGPPGGWQWVGSKENGQRWTLRFLHLGAPGKQDLWIGADESPVLWWIKVTDLEPGVIEAIE